MREIELDACEDSDEEKALRKKWKKDKKKRYEGRNIWSMSESSDDERLKAQKAAQHSHCKW